MQRLNDIMSSKCYKPLGKHIHVVANTTKANPENKYDKLLKIHPILEGIRDIPIKVKPEEVQSLDK